MNNHALVFTDWATFINGVAKHVHDPTEGFGPHRDLDPFACVGNFHAPSQSVSSAESNGAHDPIAKLLLNLQRDIAVVHFECIVDFRHCSRREFHVHYGADDLYHVS